MTSPLLHHALVTAPGSSPDKWILFLHGILGSGDNWRGFAKRLVEAHPDWGAVLVDLRKHGRSQDLPPPHTLEAAADDLVALESALPGPVRGILGHSFGGKVTLAYLQKRADQLGPVIVVDSNPGMRPDARGSQSTLWILRLLRENTGPFESRTAFVNRLVEGGVALGIAQWLAKNVELRGDRFFFKLDLDAIDELLDSYFATDLWHLVEAPPARSHVWLILGGLSDNLDSADKERAFAAAQNNPRTHVRVVENAGHWVHVDAPDAVFAILNEAVSSSGV